MSHDYQQLHSLKKSHKMGSSIFCWLLQQLAIPDVHIRVSILQKTIE